MYGVQNIKRVIGTSIEVAEAVSKIKADGKFTLLDIRHIFPLLDNIPGLIIAIPKIKDEYFDLDEAENAEIDQYVMDLLEVDKPKVKKLIMHCLDLTLDMAVIAEDVEVIIADIKDLKIIRTTHEP